MLQRCRPTSRTHVLTTRAANAPATPSGSSCSRVEPCAIASATARARVHAARFTCADGAALLHDPLAAVMLDSVAAPPYVPCLTLSSPSASPRPRPLVRRGGARGILVRGGGTGRVSGTGWTSSLRRWRRRRQMWRRR